MARNSAVDDKDVRQLVIDAVVSKLKEIEYVTHVRATFATNVKLKDGGFKTKPVLPEVELLFKGMRSGARSAFIFEFEPVGAPDWDAVEFGDDKVFLGIPEFERALVDALGFIGEEISWKTAMNRFVAQKRAELQAERELLVAEQKAKNEEDPEWGLF